jgi:uncharacterized protein (TIGR02646 family)
MIRIKIPSVIPEALKIKGVELTKENCSLYLTDAISYNTGKKKFDFLTKVYGCAEVKDALKKAHNDKCCYCESKFLSTSYGAVEHFRPKGNSKQGRKQKKIYPGYYWLAYDWENLLFICERCNTNKSTYFPLNNPTQRATNHSQLISTEIPLLIHPACDNPSDHITFHEDAPVGLTEQGKTTIEYIKLDANMDLFESRKKVLDLLKSFIFTAQKLHNKNNDVELYEMALNYIREYISPSAEYSAMTNTYFSQFSNDLEFATI